MSVRLVIQDEVNIKFENLPLDARKKLSNTFKYEIPYARYHPAYKLGRWDGMVSLFGLGGTGYLSQLEQILEILHSLKVTIDDIDDRRTSVQFSFDPVTETYWADQGKVWPVGHQQAGQPIMLRDYQVFAINNFLTNTQSLQEIATGAGKTITTATLSQLAEKFGRTITIVPNKSLVEQTEEDFINVGLDVGGYYGDRKDINKTHTDRLFNYACGADSCGRDISPTTSREDWSDEIIWTLAYHFELAIRFECPVNFSFSFSHHAKTPDDI